MKKSFLSEYVNLNTGTEVPEIFTLWCGLAGISAMLGRNVWLDMGNYTLYPNMYVVLVAGSGHCRKSTAIDIIEDFLMSTESSPNFVGKKTSTEALIGSMQQVEVTNSAAFLKKSSVGYIVVDELVNFLNKKTYQNEMAQTLISFYDCKKSFKYVTKARGEEILKDVCFGMLAGTTVDLIRDALPSESVGSGLTSRMLFIYTDSRGTPVPRFIPSKSQLDLKGSIVSRLELVSKFKGEVYLEEESWAEYDRIYHNLYANSPFYTNVLLRGYASRRHTHLLTVAICLAASETQTERLIVTKNHVVGADGLLKQMEEKLPAVLIQIASSEKGDLTSEVLKKIRDFKGTRITRPELIRAFSHKIDLSELTQIIETLKHSNQIKEVAAGNVILYGTPDIK